MLLFGQKTQGVGGVIVDGGSSERLGYVTVTAENAKGKQTGTAISANNGEFFLPLPSAGQYKLYFSHIGYATMTREVDYKGGSESLPEVAMANSEVEIDEITVKPLIRREADRIVYDVGNDPDAARMKMSEIMKKIPGLATDPGTGNLNYQNSSINQILFDGDEDGMISASRQYPMDFIKANVMSQIEVILPGSAEYNNEKPMINIILAKKLPNGIAWELRPLADTRGDYRGEIDAVSKINAIGIGVNYQARFAQRPKLKTDLERHNLLDGTLTTNDSESWSRSHNHNVSVNLFRSFNENKIRVNLTARTSFSKGNSYINSSSIVRDAYETVMESTVSSSHTKSKGRPRFNATGNFRHTIDKNNSYSIVYQFTDSRSDQTIQTETVDLSERGSRLSESASGTKQHVVNITYMYRNRSAKRFSPMLYATVNYINRDYHNSAEYYRYDYLLNDYVADHNRYDGLKYRQNIINGRVAYSDMLLNKMLSYRLDLNVEDIINKGVFLNTNNTKLDYNEFNFFPKVRVNYKIKSFRLNAGYDTSVKRPGMDQLNPYVDNSNPNYIRVGNPGLKGEYTHRFNIGADKSFKNRWLPDIGISYAYGFTNNAITSLSSVNADNILVASYANIAKNRQESVAFNLMLTPTEFVSIINHVVYTKNTYQLPDGTTNRTRAFSGISQVLFQIRKWPMIGVVYNYAPAFSSAQNKNNTYYHTLDASVDYYFNKIHLGGSISCQDVLHGNKKVRETIGDGTFIQYADRQRVGRSFKISLYWRFGRFKDPDKPENIKVDVYDMASAQ